MTVDAFVRHRVLNGLGAEGQDAIARALVAIVGVGGLGCPAARYLAGAGVGQITLFDGDHVSVTDLHRQVLFSPTDVGRPKTDAAADALGAAAPWTRIDARRTRIGQENGDELEGFDVILDCTDTWSSRRSVAAACREHGTPLVWGAVEGWHGQVTVFDDDHALDDVFPTDPALDVEACEVLGVLGPLCGQIGTAMATQAVMRILGVGPGLAGTLAIIDARTGVWRSVRLPESAHA